MELTGIIGWVLFVAAAIVAGILLAGQAAPRKQLAEAQAKLREAQAALDAAQKQPVPATANGAPAPLSPGVSKKLNANDAEIKRLTEAVAAAEQKARIALDKIADADAQIVAAQAKIAAAEAKAASADALMVQARSKAAEAGHHAATEAKREAESLREALAHAEAQTASAMKNAERAERERFEAQLKAAKGVFESEKIKLAAELAEARVAAQQGAVPQVAAQQDAAQDANHEPVMPARTRKPSPTKSAEIGAESPKPLVVLADTDPKSTDSLAKHLEAAGYEVRAAQSVGDALHIARTASPAALAFDGANLPDGDCWYILGTVKEDAQLKEIPVLVFAPGKDKEKAMEMGAAGCFAKPVDKAVMVATIKAAMVKRKQRARLAAASGGASGTPRRPSLLTTPTS